jgi:hypothetical protein
LTLPEQTKAAAQTARDKAKKTMREWLTQATEQRLPALVSALRGLGFGAEEGERKAARWRFDAETLQALAAASEQTGLPQTLLLSLVVRQHAAEQTEQPATPRKAKAKTKATEKPVRQKRVGEAKPTKAAPRKTRKGAK